MIFIIAIEKVFTNIIIKNPIKNIKAECIVPFEIRYIKIIIMLNKTNEAYLYELFDI